MADNSDSEYEYEEAVILVELNGIIDHNFLLQEQTPTKILGIDSEQPILQMGHYIFSGEYEDTLGTVVAYEPVISVNNEEKEIEDFKFLCKTDKKLSMKRIFLQEKESNRTDESTRHVSQVMEVDHESANVDTRDCSQVSNESDNQKQ